MSGLNQIQFGFENPLEISFEKFEKEKEKGIFFFGPHSPAAQCSACLPARGPPSPAPTSSFWAEPKPWPAGPSSRARPRPAPEPLTSQSHLSATASPFLSPSSNSFQPRAPPSSLHRIWEI
jgi:hypothetical protein